MTTSKKWKTTSEKKWKKMEDDLKENKKMEDDLKKNWKTNQSTKINLIVRDTIVNSPSFCYDGPHAKIAPFSAQKSYSLLGRGGGSPQYFLEWNPNIFFY